MTAVHVVMPAGVDDPRRPSGGNVYDRRICDGLARLGWDVVEHQVDGSWPRPDPVALDCLSHAVASVPDDTVVLVDGLVASAAATVFVPAAERIRLVVLVHLPLDAPGESAVLSASRAVVTTSSWARDQLLRSYSLDPTAVHVAAPGVDPVAATTGTVGGGELLCVAPVSPHKGHDVLVAALVTIRELPWRCRVVGSLDRDPAFAGCIQRQVDAYGLTHRVTFRGTLTAAELADAYATSDLLVHPSRGETYGMVIAEALAYGLPVVATDVGGVREAFGAAEPGFLVDADSAPDLGTALRAWLADADLRDRLRDAAAERARTLPSWPSTTDRIACALGGVLG